MAEEKLELDKKTKKKYIKGIKVKESWQYKVFRVINTIIMLFICATTLYPFLYLVAQSFSSEAAIIKGQVSIIPVGFNFTTYKSVLLKNDFEFLMYYKNTILYAVIGTFFSVLFSAMLAYPLSKPRLILNKFFVPFIIFTMYFGGGMIPNYILMTALGLRNTVFSFILPGLIGTYYVLLMKSFFASLPHELEEAGEIDGLSKYGVFFRIVFPISKPIVATMVLFYMAGYWSNWFNAFLYLEDRSKWPVAYHLRQIIIGASTSADPGSVSQENMQIAANIKSCSMVLMAVPIICVYPFIQKYFVQGMMLGGVKG
ncbi:MAG: carbohydrate ABC transporter permease [Lachnospiraceae bacterium]|nr:carbohydrate ABC transporter permease [Lachnospiraceae bacterium]MBR5917515.1 carbohydrate ABC transporter permease [Lachnospiraceae bacterium]